jgi:hypothetical protein
MNNKLISTYNLETNVNFIAGKKYHFEYGVLHQILLLVRQLRLLASLFLEINTNDWETITVLVIPGIVPEVTMPGMLGR